MEQRIIQNNQDGQILPWHFSKDSFSGLKKEKYFGWLSSLTSACFVFFDIWELSQMLSSSLRGCLNRKCLLHKAVWLYGKNCCLVCWCAFCWCSGVQYFKTVTLKFFCGLLIKMGIREYCWSHSKTNIPTERTNMQFVCICLEFKEGALQIKWPWIYY